MERVLPAVQGELNVLPKQINDRSDTPFGFFQDVWLVATTNCSPNQFAVEAIDLKVSKGEFIAIVGRQAAANPPS